MSGASVNAATSLRRTGGGSPPNGVIASVSRPGACMTANGLASVAALFSVRRMLTLFPGAPSLIIAMATMMEVGKLVAAVASRR